MHKNQFVIAAIVVSVFLNFFAFTKTVHAQAGILPRTTKTEKQCNDWATFKAFYQQGYKSAYQDDLEELLGCAIKTGKIRLSMIPFFITRLVEFLIGLAGLVAVLFIVIGGYKFVTGGITEDKEAGKKTVLHAIVGLILALSAYIIVNFIQNQLTR